MKIEGPLTADAVLTAFDDHLRRVRGVCPEARHNYMIHARSFLEAVFEGSPVDFARLSVDDVVAFVTNASSHYQPPTVQLLSTALRSLLRFARTEGLSGSRLDEMVPAVRRRPASLPRHLGSGELARLLSSLDSSSPRGLRDRAMLLLGGRLGLRASEIARLELDDIDWRSGTVTIRTRKTGHGAVLPLTYEVGKAVSAYLERGRPASQVRRVFVLHREHPGEPIDGHTVGDAVRRALRTAGIDAPIRGANLLRHSLATELVAQGSSLKEVADLFGHQALSSTQIYAKVHVSALREVALPWPEVSR
jgi:site-specific recombinase XerD